MNNIECSWWVFYSVWNQKYTKDHGLWEHFKWLNEYYSWVGIIPLALPTHQMNHLNELVQWITILPWKTLVIASVDFSHYKSEVIAKDNDKISYETLNSRWNFNELMSLDVDCPACLWVNYLLAEKYNLKIQQWYRDSSSTIVWYDLKEENTSRQFLYWE
jgi:AmmeMemoRadiSam system protein B